MTKNGVLVVGAGPTGMVLALWLTRLGVPVRLVDRNTGPGQTSRAVAVQSRTLELYRQLGLAEDVVADGLPFTATNFWSEGEHRGRAAFGAMGEGVSPYPYMLMYPQDRHEVLLEQKLAALGVRVERETELVSFEDHGTHVGATLRARGNDETLEIDYVAGCDGAHSTVRHQLGIGFEGGTYAHLFYVADIEASGASMNREAHIALAQHDFVVLFPLKEEGRARLIGLVRDDALPREAVTFDAAVDARLLSSIGVDVREVRWFSTYKVHHRVAERYRVGRAFLLGDAAHVHSPVGGQGMNTGIGDASNLAWKLAAVLGGAHASLLDTYQAERQGFAHRLVNTTDKLFELMSSENALLELVRARVAPPLVGFLTRFEPVKKLIFDTISQTQITYRGSPLAEGTTGHVRGGDRLPWTGDNFEPLESLAWQVHVYGGKAPVGDVGIPVHVFPWTDAAQHAGLARDVPYLVRPDGYVATTEDAAAYLAQLGIHGQTAR